MSVKSALEERYQPYQGKIEEHDPPSASAQHSKINVRNMPVKYVLRKIKNLEISYLTPVNVQAHVVLCI